MWLPANGVRTRSQRSLVMLYFSISVAPKGPEWDTGPWLEKLRLREDKGKLRNGQISDLPQIIERVTVKVEREYRPWEFHPMIWWLIEISRLLTPEACCPLLLSLPFPHCSQRLTFRTAYCGPSSRNPWQREIFSDQSGNQIFFVIVILVPGILDVHLHFLQVASTEIQNF